jgi:hypothetical protein
MQYEPTTRTWTTCAYDDRVCALNGQVSVQLQFQRVTSKDLSKLQRNCNVIHQMEVLSINPIAKQIKNTLRRSTHGQFNGANSRRSPMIPPRDDERMFKDEKDE